MVNKDKDTSSTSSIHTRTTLPSLLRRSVPFTTTAISVPTTTNSTTSSSRSSQLPIDRPPSNPAILRRAHSTVSISHPTDPLFTSSTTASTSSSNSVRSALISPKIDDPDPISDSESNSSGFESLLQRVAHKSIDLDARSGRLKPRNSKGKEKESLVPTEDKDSKEDDVGGLLNSKEEEEEDEPEEGEVVGREEGQPDPRDMLREQLRKNESLGRGKRRSTRTDTSISLTPRGDGQSVPSEIGSVSHMGAPDTRLQYSPRRYFILSTAGKLVFTTDEEEGEAAGYVGVMQAVISIFADEGDKLRYIDAGPTKIAFLLKPPLYLVCVSDWGEPESILRGHLEYLYLQVLSVVTHSQLTAIFARRSNFDLRRLMEGTEAFFTTLTTTLQTSLPILTSCLEVYRIEPGIRDEIAKLLAPGKVDNLLYAIVIAHSRVVTLIRPKKHSVHPTDLHLLLSTISSSSTFRTPDSESWIPICLPRFNSNGFLHAYISFITEGVGVVFVSGDKEGFFKIKELGETVKERLSKAGLVHKLEKARSSQEYSLGELAIPGVRHFLYKSRVYVQVTFPAWEGDYAKDENKFRLLTLYQRLHESLHSRSAASSGTARPGAKLVYLRTEQEAVLGWTTSTFELYLAVSPLLPLTAVVSAARAVTRWIKQEELSLFLTSAPSF